MSFPESPNYMTFVELFFKALQLMLNHYSSQAYHVLSEKIRPGLMAAFTIYVMCYGIGLSNGWIAGSMKNFLKAVLKLVVIVTFALHWNIFSDYAVHGLEEMANQIGQSLLLATPISLPQFSGKGLHGAMQSMMIEITKLGAWIWKQGSLHDFGPYGVAIIYWACGLSTIMLSLFEMASSYILLAILFGTAPIFISFTLFEKTHRFFDNWLGWISGSFFLLIFVSAATALVLSFLQWVISDYYLSKAAGIHLVSWVTVLFIGAFSVGVLLKTSNIAYSIGSGISTASTSSMLAGMVGGLISRGLSTGLTQSAHLSSKTATSTVDMTVGALMGVRPSKMYSAVRTKLRRGYSS